MNISRFFKLPNDSKLIIINGGLGNQLFQYALGIYFEQKYKKKVFFLDTSNSYEIDKFLGNKNLHDSKLNKLFDLKLNFVQTNQVLKKAFSFLLNGYVLRIINLIYNKTKFKISNNFIFDNDLQIDNISKLVNNDSNKLFFGYWHHLTALILNESFNKKINFLDFYQIPKELENIFFDSQNIAVHVRRGDNAVRKKSIKEFGTLPIKYYLSAIKLLRKKYGNLKVIFFTDDRDWTEKSLLPEVKNSIILEKKHSDFAKDFFYMSKCSHFVVSNSSFSWWSSYIARTKNDSTHIVFPSHYFRLKKIQDYYIPYQENYSIVDRY